MKFYEQIEFDPPIGKKWVPVRVYHTPDGVDVPMWALEDKYPATSPTRNLCLLAEYAELKNYDREAVKAILKKTHKINRKFSYKGEKTTVLNEAVNQDNFEMAELLLKRGANPNIDAGEWRDCAIDRLSHYPDDRTDELYKDALATLWLALQKGGNLNLVLQLDMDPPGSEGSIWENMWGKWCMFSLVAYDKYEYARDFMNRAIIYGYYFGFGKEDLYEPIPLNKVNECFITETDEENLVVVDKSGHVYGCCNSKATKEEIGVPIIDMFEYHY